ILCGGATVVTMTTAVLCAYPMSRYRFRAKRPLLLGIIFSTGLPITAIMIPVYSLFVQVNLIDSMGGAILFLGASSLPYAIFLTKGFMDGVPVEIEESAWTEGAGVYRALWSVVLPLMRPGLAVATIFTFVMMWGNFFVPFMLLLSPENLPAAVTLYTFSSQYGQVAYGVLVEIEESAWTEGAGVYRALWSVVLPLMRPGLAVATIFTFVMMWGNFFVPFMLLLSPENLPAAVTLYTFSSQYGQVAYGQLAAFS